MKVQKLRYLITDQRGGERKAGEEGGRGRGKIGEGKGGGWRGKAEEKGSDSLRLAVEEQQEADLNNWTTGEQFETQCSVYVLSVGSGGQRERRWKDTKDWTTERVAHISYNPSDLNPRSMYHKLIL